jgi:hypothetical protein
VAASRHKKLSINNDDRAGGARLQKLTPPADPGENQDPLYNLISRIPDKELKNNSLAGLLCGIRHIN